MRSLTVALAALAATACNQAAGAPGSDAPVVLELFTSQGCSSCPAADQLLARIAAAGAIGERRVVPLTFHVDYWDDLGWPDPFASPRWTDRQRAYAAALRDDRIYTPELVVGGAVGMVGSDAVAVTREVQRAARPAPLEASGQWSATSLTVAATAPADADVWVAVWDDPPATQVRRGENAGHELASRHVVRRLERVASAGTRGSATVAIDRQWRAPGAVAFAQRRDRQIIATAVLAAPAR